VDGDEASLAFVKFWLESVAAAGISDLSEGFAALSLANQYTCVVCFCDYEIADVILIQQCKHAFCNDCFQGFLQHAMTANQFPVCCVEKSCSLPIPLSTLRKFQSASNYSALVKASFINYINTNGDRFQFCPTPDCPQIYPVNAGTVQCDCCNEDICTHCCCNAHPNLDCAEYQRYKDDPNEIAFYAWRKAADARVCPKSGCGTSIEKNGGCNHITCGKCSSHICWVCMGIFPKNDVYEHMRAAHGGIGLA
jgi:hypothetical protein